MAGRKYLTVAAIALLLLPFPTARSQNPATFWSDYPACEEQCHESVWGSQQCSLQNSCGCNSGGASGCLCLADSCLCLTGSWLKAVAQCVGQQCGSAAVTEAASIVQSACNGNGFALAVPSSQLVSVGLAALPASTTAITTPTPPAASPSSTPNSSASPSSTPTSTTPSSTAPSSSDTSLSAGAVAGITIAGLVFAVTAIIVALLIGILKQHQLLWVVTLGCMGDRHRTPAAVQGGGRPGAAVNEQELSNLNSGNQGSGTHHLFHIHGNGNVINQGGEFSHWRN